MRRVVLLVLALCIAAPLLAQWRRMAFEPNVPYDGRFTFARIRYTGAAGGSSTIRRWSGT
jgi:hypothetical protein